MGIRVVGGIVGVFKSRRWPQKFLLGEYLYLGPRGVVDEVPALWDCFLLDEGKI